MEQDDHIEDDAAYVVAMRNGEQDAFEPLLARHYPSVLRLCRRIVDSPEEAHDVAQEAALQAFLGIHRLQEPARFGAWFHTIARNLARRALRRRHIMSLDALGAEPSFAAQFPADALTPDEVLAANEVHAMITTALGALSPVNQRAVVGFYLEGSSYDDLATQLGVPVSTVRGRLFQGRQQLRQVLDGLVTDLGMYVHIKDKEKGMEMPMLVPMQIHFVNRWETSPGGVPTRDGYIILKGETTPWRLQVKADAAEIDALEQALEREAVGIAGPYDLLVRVFDALRVKIVEVVLHSLVGATYFARLTLLQGKKRRNVDMRPGEALLLAVRSGLPILVAAPVLAAVGWDPTDMERLRAGMAQERVELQAQLGNDSAVLEAEALPEPAALSSEVRARIDTCLARFCADMGGLTVVLMDRIGALIAWYGMGDEAELRQYSAARMHGDEVKTRLWELAVYPEDRVGAVIHGGTQDWRLECSLSHAIDNDQHPVLAKQWDLEQDPRNRRLEQVVHELDALLA